MFTIVICTYNGEKRILDIINNIIKQEQFEILVSEILVIDNCSTDKTKHIVQEIKKINNRVRYLYEEKPGLSNARACGVRNVETEWIIFLDDDNYIQENWLLTARNYIIEHPQVGAFNGKVVPKFEFILTKEQEIMIQIMHISLACSHYSDSDNREVNEEQWTPFGAGLVIKSLPLKELEKKGWLHSKGRTKDRLISGEDTELVESVKKYGYLCGFCKEMKLYHLMEAHRLEYDYAKKLYKSFAEFNYEQLSMQPNYVLKRLKAMIWAFFNNLYQCLKLLLEKNDQMQCIKCRLKISQNTVYIINMIRDLVVIKR